MYYLYVIINNEQKIYIGHTSNLEKRINRHNGLLKNKLTSYTVKNKSGKWKLVYKEEFVTRQEAMKREKQLKSYQGRKFVRELLDKNKNNNKQLSW